MNVEKDLEIKSNIPLSCFLDYVKHFIISKCEYLISSEFLPFTSNTTCSIEIYILRLLKFFNTQESTFVIALIYLKRMKKRHKIVINSKNFHKLFLMSLTTATKFNEDQVFQNSYYSLVGGIDLQEFNFLEMKFLELMEYSLFVQNKEFGTYLKFPGVLNTLNMY